MSKAANRTSVPHGLPRHLLAVCCLAETFAPSAGFPDHHLWLEAFLRPGLRISESFTLHGGLAAIASTTLGEDYFLTGSTGRILMEDAFLGASWKHGENSFSLSQASSPSPSATPCSSVSAQATASKEEPLPPSPADHGK